MTRFNSSSPPKGKPAILPPPLSLTQIRARRATAAPKGWLLSLFLQKTKVIAYRKMCVVLQHLLAREMLRSPVASLWHLDKGLQNDMKVIYNNTVKKAKRVTVALRFAPDLLATIVAMAVRCGMSPNEIISYSYSRAVEGE